MSIGQPASQCAACYGPEVIDACYAALCQDAIGVSAIVDGYADEIEIIWRAIDHSNNALRKAFVRDSTCIGNEDAGFEVSLAMNSARR